jgi:DNA polymerase-3 subunit gamma/tau
LGQEHVLRVLKHQVNTGSVGHAYLFCGTRGTGKTTMARLLAKAVNCQAGGDDATPPPQIERPCGICQHCIDIQKGICVDVTEIDAASNNSVEDVRDLRESVIYPPASCRKKVYIIDEVHMFSKSAFNALLKTLEEPPEHVIFILCTTDPDKLPATILSRCLRFDFKHVAATEIAHSMEEICKELGLTITPDAAALLASDADGSVRDGFSLLEQCVQAGNASITRDLVLEIVGSPGDERIAALSDAVHKGKSTEALLLLNQMLTDGADEQRIITDWIEWFHSALLIKFLENPGVAINRSAENIESIRVQALEYDVAFINEAIYALSKLLNEIRWSPHKRILLEMTIIEISEKVKQGGI